LIQRWLHSPLIRIISSPIKLNAMCHLNLFLKSFQMLLAAGGLLILCSSFNRGADDPKPFVVAGLKMGSIEKSIERKLVDAYKAQFGQKAKLEQIQIVNQGGQAWLWFVGAEKGSPTFALELKASDGHFTLNFLEPLGINNCIKTGDCARCKVGCDCARDQGNDKCNQEITTSVLGTHFSQFAEVLQY